MGKGCRVSALHGRNKLKGENSVIFFFFLMLQETDDRLCYCIILISADEHMAH